MAGQKFWTRVKNNGDKGREGSLEVKQHPTCFIDSADDIFSALGLVFKTIPKW